MDNINTYVDFDKEKTLKTLKEFNKNGKKTVAIVCDNFFPLVDGVVNDVDNLATYLTQYFNVVAIVPQHNKTVIVKPYCVLGVYTKYNKYVKYNEAFPGRDNFLKECLKTLRIDLVHIHTPFALGNVMSKFAKKNNIPLIATFHSQYKRDFRKALISYILTMIMVKELIRRFSRSDEVWVMNEFAKNLLHSYGYKGRTRIMMHRSNFIAPTKEETAELLKMVNDKYNLEQEENVFTFLGTIRKGKNVHFIAKALAILKRKRVPFKMIYVGGGPDEKYLKRLIKKLKIEKECLLTGKIYDKKLLAALLLRSDLFLFPSLYDTDGLVKFEAAACRTPTIAIKNTGAGSGLTDNENAFLINKSYKEMADKIMTLLKDKKLLKKIGDNAYEQLYLPRLDAEKLAYERYLQLLSSGETK